MLALNELVPIYDMLNTVPVHAVRVLVRLSARMNWPCSEGQPLPQPAADYRVVLWKLLVILSGQLQHELSMAVDVAGLAACVGFMPSPKVPRRLPRRC